jgi:hypothetical protein
MHNPFRFTLPAVLLLSVAATRVEAQASPLPTTQPRYITIYRETIKTGHDAAHAKTEAGWPAAYEKAKSTAYYLAMASMTGPSEVWFVEPWESFGARGRTMESHEGNAMLSAELARVAMADAEHTTGVNVLEAMAMPDLSHGKYPDLSKARFFEIAVWRIRPGYDRQFADAAKTYKGLATRAMPNASWRVYSVTAGMPGGTYLIFSSVESFGAWDALMAEGMAGEAKMTPAEGESLEKFMREGVMSVQMQRYRIDPGMSYVAPETRATDPKFWMKK